MKLIMEGWRKYLGESEDPERLRRLQQDFGDEDAKLALKRRDKRQSRDVLRIDDVKNELEQSNAFTTVTFGMDAIYADRVLNVEIEELGDNEILSVNFLFTVFRSLGLEVEGLTTHSFDFNHDGDMIYRFQVPYRYSSDTYDSSVADSMVTRQSVQNAIAAARRADEISRFITNLDNKAREEEEAAREDDLRGRYERQQAGEPYFDPDIDDWT